MCTQPYIMTLGHEDEEGHTKWHLYWYAQVLGIFHINVRLLGCMEMECMEFLWVHWFGLVLLQLSQSLLENQHNMMNKFCKMMKIFV